MIALCRFYSVVGRVSIAHIIAVAVLTAAILFAIWQVDWRWGLPLNILAGAIGGAAFGKLLVDAIRRLRDAGISLRIAAVVALAVAVAAGAALFAFMASDPPWAEAVLTALGYGVPILCAIALLWPPRRGAREGGPGGDWAGVVIAALCVAGGAAALGFVAWVSIGMDANNRRNAAFAAEHDQASHVP